MNTVVIVSGGFDPCHEGHISYLLDAKKLGDILVVGINSDNWLIRKKGYRFMSWETRASVIRNLKCVDHAFRFNDDDGTAKDAIRKIIMRYPFRNYIFANGGDRTKENIPEMDLQNEYYGQRLKFVFGVGGSDKKNSSSTILSDFEQYIIQKHTLLSRKNNPNDNNVEPFSISSVAQAFDSSKKVQLDNSGGGQKYSISGNSRDGEDEILYSTKRFYSDIYDYPTWSNANGQEDK